jgi:hypothetical protein
LLLLLLVLGDIDLFFLLCFFREDIDTIDILRKHWQLSGMIRLFRHKMFFEKWFPYFLVFGATENNRQTENIFGLTKKAYSVSENDLHFKFRKSFSEFEFLILKPLDHCWTTTKPNPSHCRVTTKPPRTITEPPSRPPLSHL